MKEAISVFLLWLVWGATLARASEADRIPAIAQNGVVRDQQAADRDTATLEAQPEKRALRIFLKSVRKQIIAAAESMPADKYAFAPTEGEFRGVRSFGQQVKHLAATNHILAAAALGEEAPADAGD